MLPKRIKLFFHVAPQLQSRGWVDPVPDLLLLRRSSSAWNRTRTTGSVAWNSNHWTTEAVHKSTQNHRHKIRLWIRSTTCWTLILARTLQFSLLLSRNSNFPDAKTFFFVNCSSAVLISSETSCGAHPDLLLFIPCAVDRAQQILVQFL
jgi:hypothetical protein